MATVSFRTPELPRGSFRDELGRFTSGGNNAQYALNRRLAEDLRFQVAFEIDAQVASGRYAAYSTGRLARVSSSPQNTKVELFSVAIGNVDYLNRSEAKYWRTFEYGSAAVWKRPFIGTPLIPVKGRPLVTARSREERPSFIRPHAFIVKKEIDPANIYARVALSENLSEHTLQMARNYLSWVFGRGR